MEKKKSFFGSLVKFLLISIFILLLITGISILYYLFTKEDIKKYIPKDFLGYVKIESLSKAYDNLIDLRAIDTIIATEDFKKIYKTLQEVRRSKYAKNKLLISLINMKVDIILNKDYSPILLFDLGFKSLLLRGSKFITKFISKTDNFSIEEIKKEGYNLYKFTLFSNMQVFYFSIKNNILIFGLKQSDIEYIYKTKKDNAGIYNSDDFFYIRNQIKKGGIAEIYINTKEITKTFLKNFSDIDNIVNKLNFEKYTAISTNISNENISFDTFTNSSTTDELIKAFLNHKSQEMEVAKYLPEDTNIYGDINFESFEEFYKLFVYLQNGKYEDTPIQINDAAKLFFQADINELVFSWIGNELGFFTSSVSSSPVIFFEIKDKNKLEGVMKKMFNSILLDNDENVVFEGVKLDKTKMPEFFLTIINSFYKGFDTPYYVVVGDFIFFSMEPSPLSNLVNKYNSSHTLVYDKIYKEITANIEKKANIFLYFNLGISQPPFFNKKELIFDLIKLYEKGNLAINLTNSSIKLNFAASGINKAKARMFSGFPKLVSEGINSQILTKDILESDLPELIYIRKDNKLVVADMNNTPITGFPVRLEGSSENPPLIFDFNKNGKLDIISFTDKGILHKFDNEGKEEAPYPIETNFNNSFYPIIYKDNLVLFNNSERKMYFIDFEGNKKEFNFEFKSPLLTPPSIVGDYFAIYPKSFSGTVYLTDENGAVFENWPQEGSGISYGSPKFIDIDNNGENEIIFLTQSGILNLWKIDGTKFNNFPMKFDGVFYNQPQIGNIEGDKLKEIAILDKDGKLSVLYLDGRILFEKYIKDLDSKESKILLFDMNKDKKDEIIVYGGTNNIFAFDSKGILLPGFPLKGSTKPSFTDFNGDENYEMVVGSFDKNIYVYSIPASKN